MESLLNKHKIIEILAPSVGGAFLFNHALEIYLKKGHETIESLIIMAVLSCIILFFNVFSIQKDKYELFAMAVFSSALTAAFLTPVNKLPYMSAVFAAAFLFFKYILKDKTYNSVLLILSTVALAIFLDGFYFLKINRIILIISAILFLIPKIVGYKKAKSYTQFVLFAIVIPVVGIFIAENVGYLKYIYAIIVVSSYIGAGYFESAYLFKKDV